MASLISTSEILELVTSASEQIDYNVEGADYVPGTPSFTPISANGRSNSATTTTILAAPGASTYRKIISVSLVNRGTANNTVRLQKDVSGTDRYLTGTVTLSTGESCVFDSEGQITIYNSDGAVKEVKPKIGYTGFTTHIHKTGTAPDNIGWWYSSAKDAGFPGAWAPGSPGVDGRVTDGTDFVNDAGAMFIPNASSGGSNYITNATVWSSVLQSHMFMDLVWCNSDLTVTTTTAQAISTPTFPARDAFGTSDGYGYQIGILWTANSTNGGNISTSTIEYTNSAGQTGRTATLSAVTGFNIPITPIVGTVVWFKLQDGDCGVRSIEGITLATSLVTGSISLFVARWLVSIPTLVVGYTTAAGGIENPGVRIYDGSCILPVYRCVTATATVLAGHLSIMER